MVWYDGVVKSLVDGFKRVRESSGAYQRERTRNKWLEKRLQGPVNLVMQHREELEQRDEQLVGRDRQIADLTDQLSEQEMVHRAEVDMAVTEVEKRLGNQYRERLREINSEMATDRRRLMMVLDVQREINRDLRINKAFVPLLRLYGATNPVFARLNGLFLDDRLSVRYVTPAFVNMTQIPEEKILEEGVPQLSAALHAEEGVRMRRPRLKLTFGGRDYEVRQRSYQIPDGEGNTIGVFVHITRIDEGLFGALRNKRNRARKEYAAVSEIIKLIKESVVFVSGRNPSMA
ncbi:MAG: hypothetical protein KJ718_03115 [Nanoarchaeota archaeon]|nr:hypothetical protein [Nanoarchaeota archaeon]MBU1051520.1 hypothetical protein [Nanoarchaeota archaeon]MBU1988968.1 hypothetical protein [Nanoarchaeota archaeon]